MTQADHEWPGMRPGQADDLVNEQSQQSRGGGDKYRLAGALATAQPADTDQERNRPDDLFGEEDGCHQSQHAGMLRCVEPEKIGYRG